MMPKDQSEGGCGLWQAEAPARSRQAERTGSNRDPISSSFQRGKAARTAFPGWQSPVESGADSVSPRSAGLNRVLGGDVGGETGIPETDAGAKRIRQVPPPPCRADHSRKKLPIVVEDEPKTDGPPWRRRRPPIALAPQGDRRRLAGPQPLPMRITHFLFLLTSLPPDSLPASFQDVVIP